MKKRCYVFILISLVAWIQVAPVFSQTTPPTGQETQAPVTTPKIKAKSAIVMDAATGTILFEKDPDTKRQPASVTKIVTCLVVLERLSMDQMVTVTENSSLPGNSLELKRGEQISVRDLLYGLMVYSGNDAAVALAKEASGNTSKFAKMMDQKAKEYGAKKTHFLNPNGLNWPQHSAHLTTARDMALITREAMKDPTFRELVAAKAYTIAQTNKSKARELENTNLCLVESKAKAKINGVKRPLQYPGTIGVKTGSTSTAGGCFVGDIDHNGREIITVILASEEKKRFSDAIKLWDYCLEAYYDDHEVIKQGQELQIVPVERGADLSIMTIAEETVTATLLKEESPKEIRTEFVPEKTIAPVTKGQPLGVMKVYYKDQLICQTAALAAEDMKKGGPLSYFGIPDRWALCIYIAVFLMLAILLILRILLKKKKSTKDV